MSESNKFMKAPARLLAIVVIMLSAVSLTSCDNSEWGEYYYSPLIGSWNLVMVNGEEVDYYDQSQFTFYDDGTGVYGMFRGSTWNTYQINWEPAFPSTGGDFLYVYPWNGETWVYTYRVVQSGPYYQLMLFDTETGNELVYNSI